MTHNPRAATRRTPPPACPTCNTRLIPAIRGKPDAETLKRAEQGEAILSGRLPNPEYAGQSYACPTCRNHTPANPEDK